MDSIHYFMDSGHDTEDMTTKLWIDMDIIIIIFEFLQSK